MLKVKNISKGYNVEENGFIRILTRLGLMKTRDNKIFWALQNINFNIKKGETVGIIGSNGAGKSTLLQIIAGTLKATSGNIEKPKKIAALLELGAGFNPEYSGRENIFLNGALIGMQYSEITSLYDDIVNFAEIGAFIDRPVKTYSSGMFARLAFSIAVHSTPDLLIVDEALSVGDTSFQEKSINKMKSLQDSGTPIFFVSHSIPMVRNFCTRAIWLEHGKIIADGSAKDVCLQYLDTVQPKKNEMITDIISLTPEEPSIVLDSYSIEKKSFFIGDNIIINIKLKHLKKTRAGFGIGIMIYDSEENIISLFSTVRDGIILNSLPESFSVMMSNISLMPGKYSFSLSITDDKSTFHYDRHDYCLPFEVISELNNNGIPKYEGILGVPHEWNI